MPVQEIPKAKRHRSAWILAAVSAVPVVLFALSGMPWGAAAFAALGALAVVVTLRTTTETIPDELVLAAQRAEASRQRLRAEASDARLYRVIRWTVWVVTFFGCWIYCVATYGFLIGVGIGWLPSAIAATVAAFLWPVVAVAALVLALVIGFNL